MCEEIVRRARDEWQLQIHEKDGFLGFGKKHGFYMFWLVRKESGDYFKARQTYSYKQPSGVVRFSLCVENKDEIFRAIEAVCHDREAHDGLPYHADIEGENPWQDAACRALEAWREGESAPLTVSTENAALFASLVEAQMLFLCELTRRERDRDVWRAYVLTDTYTLEALGEQYAVTRERIRQIVRLCARRMDRLFCKFSTRDREGDFYDRNLRMIALLDGARGALVPFLKASFDAWGARKKKFALQLLFGEDVAAQLLPAVEAPVPEKKTERRVRPLWWLEKIVFPTERSAEGGAQVRSIAPEREYVYLSQFRKTLEEQSEVLSFVQNPDVVYYTSASTVHRPDFMLLMPNGRRVLVMVVRTLNLAYWYNVERFAALRRFCEENGYGYLITDGRSYTQETLMALPIAPQLVGALDSVLKERGWILWQDIGELRQTYTVTQATIAAYVLQKGLVFSTNPYFRICSPQ